MQISTTILQHHMFFLCNSLVRLDIDMHDLLYITRLMSFKVLKKDNLNKEMEALLVFVYFTGTTTVNSCR